MTTGIEFSTDNNGCLGVWCLKADIAANVSVLDSRIEKCAQATGCLFDLDAELLVHEENQNA